MNTVFADTWFYVALLRERDQHHDWVAQFCREYRGFFITTRWVLAEVANAMADSDIREETTAFLRDLEDDPQTTIIGGSDDLYHRGLALYAQRPDKTWSLTDCVSFVVMEEHGIRESLSEDRHFAQAGFVPLFTAQS